MTPVVIIAGSVLHALVGLYTRTPEEKQTPLQWKAWHTFLAGLVSTITVLAVMACCYLASGVLLPFWAFLLTADLLTVGWKLWKHQQRRAELRALRDLFDRPSLGEGS